MRGLTFDLHAAGVLAPGLGSLDDLRAACRSGRLSEVSAPLALPSPEGLPPNERRRASQIVRLALGCIGQALQASPFAVDTLRSVFATDEGTGEVCQQMLEVLSTTRQISPMLFSNSVLNAPSGYFSIACGNREPATVVSAGPESFAGGLVCAATEAATTHQPVLYVCYDAAMTAPMDELLPIHEPIASAWILSAAAPKGTPALASFELRFEKANGSPPTPPPPWLPAEWTAQSGASALAALGVLVSDCGSLYRCAIGGLMLSLLRIEGKRR
jgi:hypothetical protein